MLAKHEGDNLIVFYVFDGILCLKFHTHSYMYMYMYVYIGNTHYILLCNTVTLTIAQWLVYMALDSKVLSSDHSPAWFSHRLRRAIEYVN